MNGTYVNDITFTTSTVSDVTSTINPTDSSSIWFPYYMESTWMPYQYVEYEPLWHKKYAAIKYQMDTMWD